MTAHLPLSLLLSLKTVMCAISEAHIFIYHLEAGCYFFLKSDPLALQQPVLAVIISHILPSKED